MDINPFAVKLAKVTLTVEYRKKNKITSLNFLTKQRCGIGDKTLPKIKDFLVIADL
jgi:DNA uptake protein ComE-like DNA-binding protein